MGNRVVARTAPRMTPEQTAYSQIKPLERTMLFYRLYGIFGTSRGEPARRRGERRYALLIEKDGKAEQPHRRF